MRAFNRARALLALALAPLWALPSAAQTVKTPDPVQAAAPVAGVATPDPIGVSDPIPQVVPWTPWMLPNAPAARYFDPFTPGAVTYDSTAPLWVWRNTLPGGQTYADLAREYPRGRTYAGPTASFTIDTVATPQTTINVTAVSSGPILLGMYMLSGSRFTPWQIVSQASGAPGGIGVYNLSSPATWGTATRSASLVLPWDFRQTSSAAIPTLTADGVYFSGGSQSLRGGALSDGDPTRANKWVMAVYKATASTCSGTGKLFGSNFGNGSTTSGKRTPLVGFDSNTVFGQTLNDTGYNLSSLACSYAGAQPWHVILYRQTTDGHPCLSDNGGAEVCLSKTTYPEGQFVANNGNADYDVVGGGQFTLNWLGIGPDFLTANQAQRLVAWGLTRVGVAVPSTLLGQALSADQLAALGTIDRTASPILAYDKGATTSQWSAAKTLSSIGFGVNAVDWSGTWTKTYEQSFDGNVAYQATTNGDVGNDLRSDTKHVDPVSVNVSAQRVNGVDSTTVMGVPSEPLYGPGIVGVSDHTNWALSSQVCKEASDNSDSPTVPTTYLRLLALSSGSAGSNFNVCSVITNNRAGSGFSQSGGFREEIRFRIWDPSAIPNGVTGTTANTAQYTLYPALWGEGNAKNFLFQHYNELDYEDYWGDGYMYHATLWDHDAALHFADATPYSFWLGGDGDPSSSNKVSDRRTNSYFQHFVSQGSALDHSPAWHSPGSYNLTGDSTWHTWVEDVDPVRQLVVQYIDGFEYGRSPLINTYLQAQFGYFSLHILTDPTCVTNCQIANPFAYNNPPTTPLEMDIDYVRFWKRDTWTGVQVNY